jgi:hypothetical protein
VGFKTLSIIQKWNIAILIAGAKNAFLWPKKEWNMRFKAVIENGLKDYSQFKKKYRFLITWISKNYFCFYYCY